MTTVSICGALQHHARIDRQPWTLGTATDLQGPVTPGDACENVGCGLLGPRLKQTMKGYDEPWVPTAPPSPIRRLPYDLIGGTLDAGKAGKGDGGLGSGPDFPAR